MAKKNNKLNNYCRNCGEKVKDSFKSCPFCKTKILTERFTKEEADQIIKYQNKELLIFMILLLALMISFVTSFNRNYIIIHDILSFITSIAMIYSKMRFISSKKINYLFSICLILVIIPLIFNGYSHLINLLKLLFNK